MRVIGIDPGIKATGFGIITTEFQVISKGIVAPNGEAIGGKLRHIYTSLAEVIDEYKPTIASMENVIYYKNINSALSLGAVRGVIHLLLEEKGIELEEYSPTTIKKCITGNGRARKEQVAFMVNRLLDLEKTISHHTSDALACALVSVMQNVKHIGIV